MMPLLRFTKITGLLVLLAGCAGQQVQTTVDANVESQIIEIPDQAAKEFTLAIALMNQNKLKRLILLSQ